MKKSELKEMIKMAMTEDARTDAEQEGYKDGFDDAKDDIEAKLKDMKVSEGLFDFLKKKKEEAPVKQDDPNPIIGVDYDGNYIRKDGTMAENMNEGFLDFLKKKKKEAPVKKDDPNPIIGVDYDGNYIRKDGTMAENMKGSDEDMDHQDALDRASASGSTEFMKEEEEVNVEDNEEVDVDIEKDVEVDDESVESDIEVKGSMPGEDADEVAVQSLLMKAQEEAAKLGDEKLTDQIGNTITYFTRAHVSKVDADVSETLNEEVARFKKLAGLIK